MDSSAFFSLGMKPGDFDRAEGPIGSDDGFVHEALEAEIARGLAKNEFGVVLSNAKMETGTASPKP